MDIPRGNRDAISDTPYSFEEIVSEDYVKTRILMALDHEDPHIVAMARACLDEDRSMEFLKPFVAVGKNKPTLLALYNDVSDGKYRLTSDIFSICVKQKKITEGEDRRFTALVPNKKEKVELAGHIKRLIYEYNYDNIVLFVLNLKNAYRNEPNERIFTFFPNLDVPTALLPLARETMVLGKVIEAIYSFRHGVRDGDEELPVPNGNFNPIFSMNALLNCVVSRSVGQIRVSEIGIGREANVAWFMKAYFFWWCNVIEDCKGRTERSNQLLDVLKATLKRFEDKFQFMIIHGMMVWVAEHHNQFFDTPFILAWMVDFYRDSYAKPDFFQNFERFFKTNCLHACDKLEETVPYFCSVLSLAYLRKSSPLPVYVNPINEGIQKKDGYIDDRVNALAEQVRAFRRIVDGNHKQVEKKREKLLKRIRKQQEGVPLDDFDVEFSEEESQEQKKDHDEQKKKISDELKLQEVLQQQEEIEICDKTCKRLEYWVSLF